MDIKKRIQELSLDQKAKLYFMGLVRQGKIDTLPEDPKAAYVSMMMDKDDYGRSVSGKDKRTFMEPEDSMPAARARKMAGMEDDSVFEDLKEMATELGYLEEIGMFHDPLGYQPDTEDNESPSITDEDLDELLDIILKYVEDPDDAQAELDRFDQGGFDALSDMVAANLLRDPEYKAWDNKLHSIKEEDRFAGFADKPTSKKDYLGRNLDKLKRSIKNPVSKDPELNKDLFKKYISTYKKVEFVYTEQGGRFYGLDVYENKDQDRRSAKLRYGEANKWLKDTLSLDIDIPERYGSGMKELDSIVKKLEDLGIEASHGDYMDVS